MNLKSSLKSIFISIGYLIFHSLIPLALVFILFSLSSSLGFNVEEKFSDHEIFFDVIFCAIMLYIYALILFKKQNKEGDFLYNKPFKAKDLLFFIPIMAIGGGAAILWSIFIDNFGDKLPYINQSLETLNDAFSGIDNGAENYLWIFLSVVLVGPIMEEILFRGIIFGNMKKIMPIGLAIFLNGVFFGIFHMNLVQGVYTSIAGMVLAYVYYYSESISLVIVLHMINNFLSTFPPFVYDLVPAIDTYVEIGLLILMPLGIYNLRSLTKKSKK